MRLPILTAAGLALLLASGAAYAGEDPAAAAPAAAKPDKPKTICKRMQESGSLARRTRLCYTKEQWDKIAEAQRANSPGMTAATGSTSGN
jgi:hypothetical protein